MKIKTSAAPDQYHAETLLETVPPGPSCLTYGCGGEVTSESDFCEDCQEEIAAEIRAKHEDD